MRPIHRLSFVIVIWWYASGASTAFAQDKHTHEAAKHAAEKAEAERKHREEEAKKAARRRKLHEEAVKKAEHEKKLRAESEARIAASRKHREKNIAQKHKQTAKDQQLAAKLSKVAVELHRADHDYDWQRHEAVELVRGALHQLHEPEPNTSGKFGSMTQKQSDQILRENIPVLESIKTELAQKGAPTHHDEARVKVEEALSNLHAALKIR